MPVPAPHDEASWEPFPEISDADNAIIDEALQFAYSHAYRVADRLLPGMIASPGLADLRDGPLGRDLRRLVAVARGVRAEDRETVFAAVESILQLFFWPALASDYSVPRDFWETELGRVLARAKARAIRRDEVVSIAEAARRLGVARPTVYRWVDARLLGAIRDEPSGRTFVLRRDVDRMAAAMIADRSLEQPDSQARVPLVPDEVSDLSG